jgi:hypothetical protein
MFGPEIRLVSVGQLISWPGFPDPYAGTLPIELKECGMKPPESDLFHGLILMIHANIYNF